MRFVRILAVCIFSFIPALTALAASDVVMQGMTKGRDNAVGLDLIQENLIATFRLKDADSDGRITREELLRNASEIFLEMENKTPHVVSLEDMLSYRCGDKKAVPAGQTASRQASGEGFYCRMDANGDGCVDPGECRAAWTAVYQAMNLPRDGRLTLEQYLKATGDWFDRMDANHDGFVTLDEFLADQMGNRP